MGLQSCSKCVCVCVCVSVCLCLSGGVQMCVSRSVKHTTSAWAATSVYRSSFVILHYISNSFVLSPCVLCVCVCVCVCVCADEEIQQHCGFSCLIMRVHKMNDGMHHWAICAHMGSLVFWLMCVHACVWMKCTIDSLFSPCPICSWRSGSWGPSREGKNLCLHSHTHTLTLTLTFAHTHMHTHTRTRTQTHTNDNLPVGDITLTVQYIQASLSDSVCLCVCVCVLVCITAYKNKVIVLPRVEYHLHIPLLLFWIGSGGKLGSYPVILFPFTTFPTTWLKELQANLNLLTLVTHSRE